MADDVLALNAPVPGSVEQVSDDCELYVRQGRGELHGAAGICPGFVLGLRVDFFDVDFGRAFRMNVIGCDSNPRKRIADLEYLEFDEFAARADVITIHIHLTADNEHFLNAERIAKMKDGVILVNTSRGKIIDEDALLEALNSGKIGGFGADVIVGEWRDDLDQHPLIAYAREHDNMTIVPHVGGVTWEAQSMTLRFVAEKMAAVMRGWQNG